MLLATAAFPAGAQARDAIVNSFDGTPIVTHFFPGAGVSAGDKAPTIMIGPGWGGSGETNANSGSVGAFTKEGYNVLTWDPRGFGGSGGTVMIDHPEFEGRDAQALVDFIAQQPEAQLDGPGDPRLGMSGGSYGGGIQLVLAGMDQRVDVIAPTIAWNSLVTSLFKSRSIKLGWGSALIAAGIAQGVAPGIVSPAGIQAGHQSQQFYNTLVTGASTGQISEEDRQWFADHGPSHLLDNIDIPTLIIQGEPDTLFTLDEADANFRSLKDNGIPLKMIWMCGGHAVCLTKSDGGSSALGDSPHAQEARVAWFARYLSNDKSVDTGPAFEWIDENGEFHPSEGYPLNEVGKLEGTGAGQLPLAHGASTAGSGVAVFASPGPVAVTAPIDTPDEPVDVLGPPKLDLTYSGVAAPGQTFVYGQIVDRERNLVVNNQATPIPVTLDGQQHSLSIPLETIASRTTAAGYELQIVPGTSVYDIQRSAGYIDITNAHVTLSVTEPVGLDDPPDCSQPQKGGPGPDKFGGSDGPDAINGGGGRDRVKGGKGNDCIAGQGGGDRLGGGDGEDLLLAGRGRDRVSGGGGRDKIRAAGGGGDLVRCGPGEDTAKVDRRDRVRGCERVKRG